MYIPKINRIEDIGEIISFIDRFSFGILLSRNNGRLIGTHIPIISNRNPQNLTLYAHMSLANKQWKEIEGQEVLLVFSEPHAYISTSNYVKEESVPTWNYMSIHIYGTVTIIHSENEILEVIELTMMKYEPAYMNKWRKLADEFKNRMLKGIVTFRVEITEIEGKAKLSQNKSQQEKENIIGSLLKSNLSSDGLVAEYMQYFNKK